MNRRDVLKLVISVLACQMVGILGSLVTTPAIPTWYASLNKPSFTPPGWVFGPVWVTLYFLMGVAVFLIWRMDLRNSAVRAALLLFVAQLISNGIWSPLFFGLKSPLLGLIDVAALWVLIVLTIAAFARLSRAAAILLVPYIAWVTLALALNFSIWRMNP